MHCGDVPDERVRQLVRKTAETGNEHAFAVCGDGSVSEDVEGDEDELVMPSDVCPVDGEMGIVHTHPNGTLQLSGQDKRTLEHHDDVGMVCVAVEDGDGSDGDGEYICINDDEAGMVGCHYALDAPDADASSASAPLALRSAKRLRILPAGSTCKSYKGVPSRSSYHKSDEVKRCDEYATPGGPTGENGSAGPSDGEETSGEGKTDKGGGGGDDGDGEAVEPVEPPKEVAGWTLDVDSERTVEWSVDAPVNAPAHVPRQGVATRTVESRVVARSHGGRFEHRWSVEARWRWEKDGEDKRDTSQVATYRRSRGDDAGQRNRNKAIQRAVEYMEEHPADEADGSASDVEWPDGVNGWERVEPENPDAPARYEGGDVAIVVNPPERADKTMHIVEITEEGRTQTFQWTVEDEAEAAEFVARFMKETRPMTTTVSGLRTKGLPWDVEGPDDPEADVGPWEGIEPAGALMDDSSLKREVARWRADYPHPLRDADQQYVVIASVEQRGETFYIIQQHLGTVDYDAGAEHKIGTEETRDEAVERARSWMKAHPPRGVDHDLPESVGGWRRTELETSGLEHVEARVSWEAWRPPTPRYPDRRKERVQIARRDGQWQVSGWYLDEDGDQIDSFKPKTLPKRGRLGGRRRKTQSKFAGLARAIKPVREHMEENPSERTQWDSIPRFKLETKNRHLRDALEVVKRVADRDAGRYDLSLLEVTASQINLEGDDDENTSLFDVSLAPGTMNAEKHNTETWDAREVEPGSAAFDAYDAVRPIVDANLSEHVRIQARQPSGTNHPVMLEVKAGGTTERMPLWPEDEYRARVPDVEYVISFDVSAERVTEFIDNAAAADEHTRLVVEENGDAFYKYGDQSNQLASADVGEDVELPVTQWYTSELLRRVSLSVTKPASTTLTFRMSEEKTGGRLLRVEWKTNGRNNHVGYLQVHRIPPD